MICLIKEKRTMKKFVVIGLGNFGMNISRVLMENNCEVLGIDTEKNTVQKARDITTHAVLGDAADRSVLESLSIADYDGAVVSIGQEMGPSILIALYLKEIGVGRIIVRAISEDHEKILQMLGVTDIIFPERDTAIKIGMTLSMKNALDYLPLTKEYSILDVTPPKHFIGRTLKDLQISSRYRCQVIGIKYNASPEYSQKQGETVTNIAPAADDIIPAHSVMIVLGKITDIRKLEQEA